MLRLLRRHVKPGGKLLFSLYIKDPDRPTQIERAVRGGVCQWGPRSSRALGGGSREGLAGHAAASPYDPRFTDEVPDQPLLIARYRRDDVARAL